MDIRSSDFGDFIWGVSTAAFQTEGACDADGKGPSIWDEFTSRKGKIHNNDSAKEACNAFTLYEQDNKLMKQLNIRNHRFSLSWSRILPEGTGCINQKGIDHYNRVIDHTLASGIEPWVTLYHWDLPLKLQRRGGWINRDIVNWFNEYCNVCVKHFGDRVKNWMVLNEPMVFTGAGYFLGVHAPGKTGLNNFLSAVHHAVLAQSSGSRCIREADPSANIGTTFSCSYIEPDRYNKRDLKAAAKVDTLLNRVFIEPLLGMGYPEDLKILRRMEDIMQPGDEQLMAFDMDFIGIQNYTREVVQYSMFTPFIQAKIVDAEKRKVKVTEMNWEIYPPALYHMLRQFGSYENVPPIIITENGAAFNDIVKDNVVNDEARKFYLQENIRQVYKALRHGVDVKGYFIWTLLDNFEWAEGYRPKFGIIHVNFDTQKRIIKDSGLWYSDFLQGKVAI